MRQRRSFWGCAHSSTITTITAGLAREVCEACGHVSVSYIEETVQIFPDLEGGEPDRDRGRGGNGNGLEEIEMGATGSYDAVVIFEDSTRLLTCGLCDQQAVFMVPDGLRCDEHAWQAAARLDWGAEDPWVPIRLDRSSERG